MCIPPCYSWDHRDEKCILNPLCNSLQVPSSLATSPLTSGEGRAASAKPSTPMKKPSWDRPLSKIIIEGPKMFTEIFILKPFLSFLRCSYIEQERDGQWHKNHKTVSLTWFGIHISFFNDCTEITIVFCNTSCI